MNTLLCMLMALAAGATPKLVPAHGGHDLHLTLPMLRALDAWEPAFRPWKDRDYDPEILQSVRFSAHQAPFAIITDFNGDGRPDAAIHGNAGREDVVVAVVSGDSGSYRAYSISRAPLLCPEPGGPPAACRLDMFLELTPRGTHFTGAFAGYPLTLRRDGFQIVWYEKASQLYFWSGGKFELYVTGD